MQITSGFILEKCMRFLSGEMKLSVASSVRIKRVSVERGFTVME